MKVDPNNFLFQKLIFKRNSGLLSWLINEMCKKIYQVLSYHNRNWGEIKILSNVTQHKTIQTEKQFGIILITTSILVNHLDISYMYTHFSYNCLYKSLVQL